MTLNLASSQLLDNFINDRKSGVYDIIFQLSVLSLLTLIKSRCYPKQVEDSWLSNWSRSFSPEVDTGLARLMWVRHRNPPEGQQSSNSAVTNSSGVEKGDVRRGMTARPGEVCNLTRKTRTRPACAPEPCPGGTATLRDRQGLNRPGPGCSDLSHWVPLMWFYLENLHTFISTFSFLEYKMLGLLTT